MSAQTAAPTDAAPMDHRHVMRALSGLLIVLFVAMISSTVVSVALPQIIGSLNGTQSQYTWVVTAMLLASTASTPIWGKLADLFSKKLLLQISIGIFVVASVACGFAQSTEQLIAFRAVQGLGMGALQVLVQVIIAAMISPKERGRYNGYLGGVMAVATVGGPLLGGFITDTSWLGWRWCFFIAVPFTLVAFVMLTRTLHLAEVRRPDVKVDYLGAALIAAGVSLLLLWVTFVGNDFGWLSWQTVVMVGASVAILGAAVAVEARVKEPVVPLHVVRRRDPALAIVASLAVGMAMFGGAVFLGQYFQIGRGYSPTEAGLLTIPLMAGVLVSSTVAGRWSPGPARSSRTSSRASSSSPSASWDCPRSTTRPRWSSCPWGCSPSASGSACRCRTWCSSSRTPSRSANSARPAVRSPSSGPSEARSASPSWARCSPTRSPRRSPTGWRRRASTPGPRRRAAPRSTWRRCPRRSRRSCARRTATPPGTSS